MGEMVRFGPRRAWPVLVVGLATLLALALLAAAPADAAGAPGAPAAGDRIPGQYIVVFNDQVSAAAVEATAAGLLRGNGGTLRFVYSHALRGFAASMSASAAAALSRNPLVAYVEQDGVVEASDSGTQSPAPSWGLDRIDQHTLPLDNSYTYAESGSGVTAYIIDTGIDASDADFGGRAVVAYDAVGGRGSYSDCNGHGTHVAGTVGGSTYGVAKDVTLVGVRVLNCRGSGTWSQVIAGIDWVTANHNGSAVANMSLGGGFSATVNQAVENSTSSGVTYAIAAGNSGANACNYSPASAPSALTVGATDQTDTRASWSNYGSCLDLFAPGVGITSDWLNGGTNTISGTSMATPHVTGVAARYLEAHPGASASAVAGAITSTATSGVVKSSGSGSPNLLLYADPGSSTPVSTVGTVTGQVTDAGTSNGISGATVSISGTALTATTDGSGNYSISNVPTGTQTVSASATGYITNATSVSVSSGGTATANIALTPESSGGGGGGGTTVHVASIDYSTSGGRNQDKHLAVTLTIEDASSAPVSGAAVSIDLSEGGQTWTASGTTGTSGSVSFTLSNAPSGTYTTTVTDVSGGGLTWDGVTPANSFTK